MLLTSGRSRPAVGVPSDLVTRGFRVCRWVATAVMVSAVVLVPWIAYLATNLPPTASARHWPAAWAGLDAAIAIGLAATGWLALRRDRRVAFCAASTATVLVVDAWFDVCTSPPGRPLSFALVDMCVELGEAAACLLVAWIVWHDEARRGN
jgi:hypothetical protein